MRNSCGLVSAKCSLNSRPIRVALFVMQGVGRNLLAVHPDTVAFNSVAGIAVGQFHLKRNIAGGRRSQRAGPANRKCRARNAVGMRAGVIPVIVDVVRTSM